MTRRKSARFPAAHSFFRTSVNPIWLSLEETKFLMQVLEIHEEGIEASKDPTIEDPTIESIDELLELMDGYNQDLVTLQRVRNKLQRRVNGRDRS